MLTNIVFKKIKKQVIVSNQTYIRVLSYSYKRIKQKHKYLSSDDHNVGVFKWNKINGIKLTIKNRRQFGIQQNFNPVIYACHYSMSNPIKVVDIYHITTKWTISFESLVKSLYFS